MSSVMEELLEDASFENLKEGSIIEGTIIESLSRKN
jgi:ribosomal protein S1